MDETGAKITALDALTDGASDDLLAIVDVSDNNVGEGAMSVDGTNKKITLANLLSWIKLDDTVTYASATTFTIAGDWTGILQKGDKFKCTQTSVKYFYIIGVSYSSPNTTVTVTGGSDYTLADAAITSPYFSKVENPQGFPTIFNYSPTYGGFSADPTEDMYFFIKGKVCYVNYQTGVPGTSNANTFTISAPVVATGDGRAPITAATNSGALLTTAPGSNFVFIGTANATTLRLAINSSSVGWSTSGIKRGDFQIFYPI